MITLRNYMHSSTLLLVILFATISKIFAQPEPTLAWASTINNLGACTAGLVTYDPNGNTYVIISFSNTSITIGGVTITHTSSFGKHCIIKYDASGNGVWIKEIPFVFQAFNNTNPHKFLYNNGKLYLFTLYDQNNIIMDGFQFPPRPTVLAVGNPVLIQMDAEDGTTQWIRTIACPNGSQSTPVDGVEIYVDQEDKIHALGRFSDTFIFDTGDTLSNSGNPLHIDAFHAVYDVLGNVTSAHTLGVNNMNPNFYSYEYFHMDNQKNIYRFVKDTKTFIKYNEQGDTLFTKTFSSGAVITGMTVDPWQNVFLSGYFSSSTMSFDGLSTSKTGGTTDAILIKFNSNDGTVEWLKNLGEPLCDRFDFIKSDATGNIYVLNNQYGGCQTPGASLMVKYNNDGEIIWQKNINTHPGGNPALFPMVRAGNISLSPDGGTIILSGYSQFAQNDQRGFVAQYGICNTPQPILTVSNTQFCQGDSAVLSVTTTPGYRYLWSNGDTTNTSIYVSSSGKYSVVAIQSDECYATSQDIYITMNPFPDTNISLVNTTLTAAETTQGTTYQWLDCDNNYTPINGANSVSFTPIQNGTYALVVSSATGCSDTSACFTIDNLSINTIKDTELVKVYPNPATDEINVQSELKIKFVRILDLQGKELLKTKESKIAISNLSSGIYLIEIHTPKGIGTKKFIKE